MDTELWRRIEEFEFDEGAPELTFAARLAREQGWTSDEAAAAIAEYRRFVYLACTCDHAVTPSVEVDEVWHLHLTYTRSYWDRLCGDVLRRPLHHDPTRGGSDERAKFHDLYDRTRASYRAAFGVDAPARYWSGPRERFASLGSPGPTDTASDPYTHTHAHTDGAARSGRSYVGIAAALTVALVLGTAGAAAAQTDSGGSSNTAALIGFFVVAALIVVGAKIYERVTGKRLGGGKKQRSGWWDSGCSNPGSCSGDSGCSGCGGD